MPLLRGAPKLQGQYVGYLQNLKTSQKAQVKAVRATKGMREAIRMARPLSSV